ncbi:MAG: hypothetical protein N5P05_002674 [Chroococcopsis gigantea SAG 12.99]|nr:hypothetical protein [Chroococcopsis gigantea SAG 12.99]
MEKKLTLLDIYKQTLNQLFALIAKHYLSFIIGSFSLLLLMGFCIGFLTSTHIVFYDKQPQNNNKNSPSDLSQSDSINKLAQKISSEILNSADPNKMSKLENIKILAPNNRKIYVKDTENLKKILEIYVKETKKQDLKENVQKPTGSDEYKNKYKDIKCKVASEINIKKVTDCST